MTTKFDVLGHVIPADQRPRIEAALAKKVPKVSAAEITAFDLVYQEKFRAEHGECSNCYLRWPEGTEGVPPRPQFEDAGRWRSCGGPRRSVNFEYGPALPCLNTVSRRRGPSRKPLRVSSCATATGRKA
jgi:hypothetical protein